MNKRYRFLALVLICAFTMLPTVADSETKKEIRVLILDERFPELPDGETEIRRIGNIQGELLVSGTKYRGHIEVWKGKRGLYLINELPLEDYVRSVVISEVAEDWEMEALKAQAVIARTYALKHLGKNNGSLYDLTSSTLHQLYRGDNFDTRVAYAVMKTEGEVLTYNGELIEAFYHSTCGGKTELPEEVFGKSYPYLKSVSSDCSNSPYWFWQRRIKKSEIERATGVTGLKEIEISEYTKTGRVRKVKLIHGGGTTDVLAKDLRRLLGWRKLPSTWFKIKRDKNSFIFDGHGYGHGVGLCQWGAQKMAEEGKNYREILSFYYPGTTIMLYENR
ncbi:MAG: SpoIID/LytB domain-containing protein [Nitrospirae bacterium]|nr:MAG: SpoIID/LytB domain-containing protein [Nitrospirota bacterium]